MNTPAQPVLIMAGGTGGHIFPGIAVAEELLARAVPVVWLGSVAGLEERLVPRIGVPLHTLHVGGVRGKGLPALLLAPWRIGRAVVRAWRLMRALRPRCALALGGFACGPGGIAAWLRRVPLVVHEQNRVAGFTNRILARFACRRLCGFADALPRGIWVGNPVRREIAAVARTGQRLREGRLRLLVLGGSQGAAALNRAVPAAVAELPATLRPQVRHQCGARHLTATRQRYAELGVEAEVIEFIEDMAEAYAWADLAICRAGALTLAELCAVGLPAVLVPFPSAVDDHQTRNADVLVAAGAARLVVEGERFAERLRAVLGELLAGDPEACRARLESMAHAARGLAKPEAAARIAAICLEVAA
jgi:UDP-N-acetylglucosamine--N-acetylmuramyl-(pentapeptide) pyrophosphoryl-undecaprenol N-acetylglucosamine transferase